MQILAPTGEFVSLQHDAKGMLLKVTDPQGRSLHLHYLDRQTARAGDRFRGVQSIDSPVGRFRYDYGSALPSGATLDKIHLLANLVKVSLPPQEDGSRTPPASAGRGTTASRIARHYHYEDPARPTLLTGITVSGAGSDGQPIHQRLVTWAYDRNGRAILSVKGEPLKKAPDGKAVAGTGIEQVTLDRSEPGMTVLTNSLGQTTTYKHAIVGGEYRLLEVRGPGCASCGATNVKYDYDKLGRLTGTTRLTEQGQPAETTRTERDGVGRTVKVSRIVYRNGKPGQAQLLARYAYPATPPDALPGEQPVLIARPSVVSGREHQIRVGYNDKGQPLRVTESGWSPAIDGKAEAAAITRTTDYRYATINGRSLLTTIDGPLPNGPANSPADSDITRAEWDASGNQVIAWIAPGNFRSRIDYDKDTGRLIRVRNADGFHTAFAYDPSGRIERIRSAGPGWVKPQVQSIKYDALGHPTERGSGGDADHAYRPRIRQAFDASGRLLWKANALGVLEQHRYDTESQLIESGRYSNRIAQVTRTAYDLHGRVTQVADNRGARIAIAYDDQGVPESVTDALGRVHAARPARTADATVERLRPRHLADDFGRTIATLSPDSGITTRRFDAADRLIGSTDAQGNRAVYEHDAAGRIARQQITDRRTGQTSATVWRYQGKHLVALEHPTQAEQYRYDERGLRIAKTVTRKRHDGSELASVTRYGYDDDGALQSVSLPDGSRLVYERNGQGQVVGVKRSRIRTSWLRWLLPAQTLAKDIERDLAGLRHYATGNGIEAGYQRSREGVLARVMVRRTTDAQSKRAGTPDLPGIAAAHAGEVAGSGRAVVPVARPLP
ncbi:MAG: RHS repeat-associated core domain-containing protein, partial [Solimonas sp.]